MDVDVDVDVVVQVVLQTSGYSLRICVRRPSATWVRGVDGTPYEKSSDVEAKRCVTKWQRERMAASRELGGVDAGPRPLHHHAVGYYHGPRAMRGMAETPSIPALLSSSRGRLGMVPLDE